MDLDRKQKKIPADDGVIFLKVKRISWDSVATASKTPTSAPKQTSNAPVKGNLSADNDLLAFGNPSNPVQQPKKPSTDDNLLSLAGFDEKPKAQRPGQSGGLMDMDLDLSGLSAPKQKPTSKNMMEDLLI
jgi:hypothetical protein